MAPDDLSSEAQRSGAALGDEERGVSGFQDAFRRIKEATGVTDTREVVERFVSQGDTQKHLTSLKEENQRALTRLKQERDGLQESFQDMKYSGEAQLSSGQQTLEERERRLVAEERSRDAARERLDWLSRTLGTARAGVEHLAHKLRHIELEEGVPPESSVDGEEEAVSELLSCSERKLQLLWAELKGKDLAAVMKEMEEEEFHASIEGKLPHYNTRIKLPEAQKQDPYDEDEDSGGDDEGDIITRAMLKRQSQLIIDSKTKRKTRTKKKKGKL